VQQSYQLRKSLHTPSNDKYVGSIPTHETKNIDLRSVEYMLQCRELQIRLSRATAVISRDLLLEKSERSSLNLSPKLVNFTHSASEVLL
jgi:hypothetical protein